MREVASVREGFRWTAVDQAGTTVAALEPNEWETSFFGRRLGRLSVVAQAAAALSPGGWREAVSLAAAEADSYDLVQVHLDVRRLPLAPALEEAGFRLVDTRISFVTRLDRRSLVRYEPPLGHVGPASPGDLPALLDLAHRRLTHNPRFHSRYKDRDYFTPQEATRWFAAWVENDLADPGSRLAVWRIEGRVEGFFGYRRQEDREGLPFYKSSLAAVEDARRGQKAHLFLQTALFDGMPTDLFWVDNTTQLGNWPVIHNHLLTGRRLDRIELTFFRTPRP